MKNNENASIFTKVAQKSTILTFYFYYDIIYVFITIDT